MAFVFVAKGHRTVLFLHSRLFPNIAQYTAAIWLIQSLSL